jgi:hypothetical protein
MCKWFVYLDGHWINSVFYDDDCDGDYVRDGLINHDGMPDNIQVRKENTNYVYCGD